MTRLRLLLALKAYPRAQRERDGQALLDLAEDLIDGGSSPTREAAGLAHAGLRARAGGLADAPWGAALHRLALPVAVVLAALVGGVAVDRLSPTAWPGFSWLLVLAGPALALAGLLTGRRGPLAACAASLLFAGVAQGNGRLGHLGLWGQVGATVPLLAVAIPFALLLLLCAAATPRPPARGRTLAALAWTGAGALAVRVALEPGADGLPWTVAVGGTRLEPLGIVLAAVCVLLVLGALAGLARSRRAPQDALAGGLVLVAMTPGAALYGLGSIQTGALAWVLGAHLAVVAAFALQARRLASR